MPERRSLLEGSWVVISGVISPRKWVISIVTLLITPLITPHEAGVVEFEVLGFGFGVEA